MVARQLTEILVADLDPIARPVATGYLCELSVALPGSRRSREAIVTEIADGLIEQILRSPGPDPAAAARTALQAFGDPRLLAAQFGRELTGKAAHRTGLAFLGSGPPIGMLWLLALAGGPPRDFASALPGRIAVLFTTIPLIPVLLLIIVPAALVSVAGAGWVSRVLPVTTGTAGLAGVVAGTGCIVIDVVLIGHAASAAAWSPLLLGAATMSSARLSLAAAAARRCAQCRAGS